MTMSSKTYITNSGIIEWEWGGAASLDGFTSYVKNEVSESELRDYSTLTRHVYDYLLSVSENPKDYLSCYDIIELNNADKEDLDDDGITIEC